VKGARAAAAILLLAASAAPAAACSFSWREGHSPADVRMRTDVRVVTGTFRNVRARGYADEGGRFEQGVIEGEVIDRAGRIWPTSHPYDSFSADCGAIRTPTHAGTGRYWISRRRTDNRYQMMLWNGRYLPRNDSQTRPPE